jgi:hypothetical protein
VLRLALQLCLPLPRCLWLPLPCLLLLALRGSQDLQQVFLTAKEVRMNRTKGGPMEVQVDVENNGFSYKTFAYRFDWVDAKGNGTWAVGIRSAQINGTHTRIHAGVGVVADSQAEQELAETRAKLQTMLGAIVRP